MKNFIKGVGFKFVEDYDDLTDKQFTLESTVFMNSEGSVLGNIIYDRIETYRLFVKKLDTEQMIEKIEAIVNSALIKNVNLSEFSDIEAEKVENGYEIKLQFRINGNLDPSRTWECTGTYICKSIFIS